jgi:hypothetical protein
MAAVDGMPTRHNITKIMNNLTAQFNLFKERWLSGDNSLNFIEKTALTKEEKMIVKQTFKKDTIMLGLTKMAKEFGVTEPILREYISTII